MSNPQIDSKGARFWRLVNYALVGINLSALVVVCLVLTRSEWHPNITRLMGRAWEVFVSQDVGSTSRGFINGIVGAVGAVVLTAVTSGSISGLKELRKNRLEAAITGIFAFATVTIILYGAQFVWESVRVAFQDHQGLARRVAQVSKERDDLKRTPEQFDARYNGLKAKYLVEHHLPKDSPLTGDEVSWVDLQMRRENWSFLVVIRTITLTTQTPSEKAFISLHNGNFHDMHIENNILNRH